ncbi:hypothetical protein AAKU67_000279 [Oxalobacteraceae bacterium GrIS 2.11]
MDKNLSIDEFDALEQIGRLSKNVKPTACVNRNAKRLCGIKFASYRKDGQLELTDEGKAVLFSKHCIEGLRAVVASEAPELDPVVFAFLSKKSFITSDANGVQITQRGLECLADIDAQRK